MLDAATSMLVSEAVMGKNAPKKVTSIPNRHLLVPQVAPVCGEGSTRLKLLA